MLREKQETEKNPYHSIIHTHKDPPNAAAHSVGRRVQGQLREGHAPGGYIYIYICVCVCGYECVYGYVHVYVYVFVCIYNGKLVRVCW